MSHHARTNQPLGDPISPDYDARRYTRLMLSNDGYHLLCQSNSVSLNTVRLPLRLRLCDINIRGVGMLGEDFLQPGDGLIVPSPQHYPLHAHVVHCTYEPDSLHQYRIGLLWEKFPPVHVFLQWEHFLLPDQLPEFHEQVSIIDSFPY